VDNRGVEYFVSTSGRDDNPGSLDRPFRTIGRGVTELGPGDVLSIRHGVYVESVDIAAKKGTVDAPIVIRSLPGERAIVDGTVDDFRRRDNSDWLPGHEIDTNAAEDEYVSARAFTEDAVNRGAFLDRNPYTRVITYSRLEDLRAGNQTFERLDVPDPLRPGPEVTDEDGNRLGFSFPWVYMGPGIWFDDVGRRVHVRLSHTTNDIPGLDDYRGETDPRRTSLAISPRGLTTLRIRGSSHLRLEHLTVRFGGHHTMLLESIEDVVLDHLLLQAATFGIRMGGESRDVALRHCELRGGVPTWYFRNDRKAEYFFILDGEIVHNNRGAQTSDRLLYGNPNNAGIEIANCEFLNAHDVFLHGRGVDFHHNWVNNLQDEGLYLDDGDPAGSTSVAKIHENVVTMTLSALGFSGRNETIEWFIYRNLIDLRRPTAGFRPRRPGDTDVWRHGHLYKSNPPDGPIDLFQNTFLVYDQRAQASFTHYRETTGPHRRRSFNNLFVSVNPVSESDIAITFVPSPAFRGCTDGNCYHRKGHADRPAFRHLGYVCDGQPFPDSGTFANLDELRGSVLFGQSETQCPPGYEANSLEADPRVRRLGADGRFRETDDLRLRDDSPAIAAGVPLEPALRALDPVSVAGAPDIGRYPLGAGPLRVGVDGRRSFPRAV
jgi:hypothetical protein